jgi:glucose dehydrogenase
MSQPLQQSTNEIQLGPTVDSNYQTEDIAKATHDAHEPSNHQNEDIAKATNDANAPSENQTAMLYSLNTPCNSTIHQFDSEKELIYMDAGASACNQIPPF